MFYLNLSSTKSCKTIPNTEINDTQHFACKWIRTLSIFKVRVNYTFSETRFQLSRYILIYLSDRRIDGLKR